MEKKYYFASDFHLGIDYPQASRIREQTIVAWLDSIFPSTKELFLLGDLFDYWYEYSEVVPKGYVRLLGKLAEFTDSGIPVHVFTGNHDMWMFDYLQEEIGIRLYKETLKITLDDRSFLLGHGDGLGPGDHGYKFIKKVFSNKINQWLFARIHSNTGLKLMRYFSKSSREAQEKIPKFKGPRGDWLIQYCERKIETEDIDYFIFGHRHIPIDYTLSNGKSRYINAGDWLYHNSYVSYDGLHVELLNFEKS